MNKFTTFSGSAVPLLRSNIDTDQIIPKQFLKRIERTGYGEFLFWDWRYQADGMPNEDFVLNDLRFSGATILLAGENFGCGSSREHAPWSLLDHGFRVIIAPGFADIFYNNSLKTGLLPVRLDIKDVEYLAALGPQAAITVDLTSQTVMAADSTFTRGFEIDPFRRHCLLNGLDDIGLTLQHEPAITEYEKRRAATELLSRG